MPPKLNIYEGTTIIILHRNFNQISLFTTITSGVSAPQLPSPLLVFPRSVHATNCHFFHLESDDVATPSSDDDCRLNLSQLRALFPSTSTTKSIATKLTQCDR